MEKKVLILCTGNSCRSIIAEALINAELDNVRAESSGVQASGHINPNAKKVLQDANIWKETYYSKTIDTVINHSYDLIVTVCHHAQETCPLFPKPIPIIHSGFEDPSGKIFSAFEETLQEIRTILLPKITQTLKGQTMNKNVLKTNTGVNITFTGSIQKQNVLKMVENCNAGACECMSTTTKAKIKDMKVTGEDGEVNLALTGNLSTQEIEEALAKSKVINL